MNFPGSPHPPPPPDRRLQRRLLGVVGLIALVMFAAQVWRISRGKGGSSHPLYRLTTEELSDPGDDELQSPPRKVDEGRIVPRHRPADTESADDLAGESRQTVVSSAWLANVQDNTLGIRRQEADGYYRILERLRSVSARELHAEADHDVFFVHLMSSPDEFRGRTVTITGELVGLQEFQERENDFGVTRLYSAWIVTPDSGNQPYRIVCQSIPPEISPGTRRQPMVRVTGCFFKNEAYETTGREVRVTPTLLAGRLALVSSPSAEPSADQGLPWMAGVLTVIGLALLATMIGLTLRDSRNRHGSRRAELIEIDTATFSRADRRLSIAESLRRLEQDEPLEGWAVHPASANGHPSTSTLPDEFVDLPTPFPPTKVPKRWDGPQ